MNATITIAIAGALTLAACQTTQQPPLSNRFEKADTDNNRVLSRAEVGTYIAGKLFDGMDDNHDGRVSNAEWNAGGNAATVRHFRKVDKNRDGAVVESELTVAAIRSEKLTEFMTEADRNRDGSLSKPEALAFYASKEGPTP